MNDFGSSTRDGFGKAIIDIAKDNKNIVVVCADVAESVRVAEFAKLYPDRFFEVGVAEQNMATIAAGMAQEGLTPFATSFACFSPGRNFDQVRVSIAYNKANVKLVSSHGGLTTGPDGATHQMLEDIAIMQALPNFTVVCPCDAEEAYNATQAIANYNSPVYLRLGRTSAKPIKNNPEFKIGKANILREGDDVTIIAYGTMVEKALHAAARLKHENIEATVVNCHTIKPLDVETIIKHSKNSRGVVVVEEAQTFGGLGTTITALLSENSPKHVRIVAVDNKFGQSGESDDLLKKYHLTSQRIVGEALKVFRRSHD